MRKKKTRTKTTTKTETKTTTKTETKITQCLDNLPKKTETVEKQECMLMCSISFKRVCLKCISIW